MAGFVTNTPSRFSDFVAGTYITKEAPGDIKQGEQAAELLLKELGDVTATLTKAKADADQQYKDLSTHYNGLKKDNDEVKEAVKQHAATYADLVTKVQTLTQVTDQIKRELDAPIIKGGKDLADADKAAAIELQRRAWMFKGGDADDFKPDMENLVSAVDYRTAVRHMMKVGIETKEKLKRQLPEHLRKAFEAASLDSALFSPELLGIEIDCAIECAELLDLYSQVTVSKTSFMYPQVIDYGDIGKYDCDAKCDAEFGREGNITYQNGKTFDFRGVFCLNRKVLAEANYDLLGFMYRTAARSYRINRNRALMIGDSTNEPIGWMTQNCFPVRRTQSTNVTHQEFRMILASVPVEYGPITIVMHQNTFAYLAAQLDQVGRFIFGDGLMSYTPNDTRENIRISNCLPDPTHNLTLGSTGNPMVTGEFFCAAGNWKSAYYAVSKRPLWIEQWEGKSTAWCVAYSFGAEDGGFVGCCPAVTILQVGP